MTFHNKLILGEGMQCFKITTLLTRISFILFHLTVLLHSWASHSIDLLNVNRWSVM